MRDIDPRLQRLLDIEQIKQLKAKYCWYADDPEYHDQFANLFAPDGRFIEPPTLEFEGREAIRRWMDEDYKPEVVWSRHFAVSPVIEVDGDSATGRWQGLLFSIVRKDDDTQGMLWAAGTYDEVYCRIGGEWLFDTVIADGLWMTDFNKGFQGR